jgi:hypothetical protein
MQAKRLDYAETVHMDAMGFSPTKIGELLRIDKRRVREILNGPSPEQVAKIKAMWRGHWDSQTIAIETGLDEAQVVGVIHAAQDRRRSA